MRGWIVLGFGIAFLLYRRMVLQRVGRVEMLGRLLLFVAGWGLIILGIGRIGGWL